MDAFTAFAILTVLVLMTSVVLSLVRRDLPADLQICVADWRTGALLFACGTGMLAMQRLLPQALILPIANGSLLLGYTFFWRAVRRFCGLADAPWIFAISPVTAAVIWYFSAIQPNLDARVVAVAIAVAIVSFGATWTLHKLRPAQPVISHSVLKGFFFLNGVLMVGRTAYFAVKQPSGVSILDTQNIAASITGLLGTFLPVLGTMAFLLLCAERIRRRWEHAAMTDELTGLANRRTILVAGEAHFIEARGANQSLSVAVIDIDHFKLVNDSFGHAAGDSALKHVARILEQHCRGLNKVGRLGGEEFVVLLPLADAFDAATAAERIRHALQAAPLQLDGTELRITASIGVATRVPADAELSGLLGRADRALYVAKFNGRNRVEVGLPEVGLQEVGLPKAAV